MLMEFINDTFKLTISRIVKTIFEQHGHLSCILEKTLRISYLQLWFVPDFYRHFHCNVSLDGMQG